MADLESLYEAILKGKLDVAKAVTTEAIAENVDPQLIINEYMSRAMEDIGKRFEEGKAFVPELLMAARAMKGALDLLKPLMKGSCFAPVGQGGNRYGERRFARHRKEPGRFHAGRLRL